VVIIVKAAPSVNNRGSDRTDDRIKCPSCDKKIIPRLITYQGEPEKSVCPFCGATVRIFGSNILGLIILAIIALVVMAYM
jgi:cold shock protein